MLLAARLLSALNRKSRGVHEHVQSLIVKNVLFFYKLLPMLHDF